MKFYLCQTPDGPRYARTQADAKALDPKFTIVNHDIDQASLVALFNGFIAASPAPAAETPDEEPVEAPVKAKKGAEDTSLTDWAKAPPAGSCERCTTMSAAARHLEGIMSATNITHAIDHGDEKLLAKVEKAITDRREELAHA